MSAPGPTPVGGAALERLRVQYPAFERAVAGAPDDRARNPDELMTHMLVLQTAAQVAIAEALTAIAAVVCNPTITLDPSKIDMGSGLLRALTTPRRTP